MDDPAIGDQLKKFVHVPSRFLDLTPILALLFSLGASLYFLNQDYYCAITDPTVDINEQPTNPILADIDEEEDSSTSTLIQPDEPKTLQPRPTIPPRVSAPGTLFNGGSFNGDRYGSTLGVHSSRKPGRPSRPTTLAFKVKKNENEAVTTPGLAYSMLNKGISHFGSSTKSNRTRVGSDSESLWTGILS